MTLNLRVVKPFRLVLVFVLFLGLHTLSAQPITITLSDAKSKSDVKHNDFYKSVFHFNFQSLQGLNVETEKGAFTELFLEKGHYVGEFGAPKLPASKHLIEIPFGAEVEILVKSYTKTQIKLSEVGIMNQIMPTQPMLRKDQDVSEVPFEYKLESFEMSSFNDYPIATVDILGVMRGVRIAQITIAPVKYNPVEGLLEVYNDLEIELVYRNSDIAKTQYLKASTFSPHFEPVFNKLNNRLNTKNLYDDYPDLTKNPIKMVIVSNRMFEETLQPFIEWKTQQGIYVTVGYTDVIGATVNSIKNYIHDIYNSATPENPAPTYLILVGDPGTMPASANGSATSSVTDLYYASVDGDMFPEMYFGRLSARNVQELQNQIDKILYYQKYEFDDPTYLNNVTLIAGSDGTWNPRVGQPTIKYGTANYFNAANGFGTVWGYGVTNDPNNPNNSSGYAGCYENPRISVSMINFTAHCSPTSWSDPTLTPTMVHNMTNTGKYPLAIGNCCQSAQFSHTESIGEAWVRAQNKGAVAYIGSSPNTHWFNDFYWAVGAFHITGNNDGYVPTVAQTSTGAYDAPFVSDYLSVDALKFVGNLAISQAAASGYPTHQSALYYWQAYHTFGDPSTYIYLKEGLDNAVSHMPIVPIGLDFYTVQALPGSYVGISKDGVLHGAAFVGTSGEVDVPILPILDGGDVMIVVTKPQHIPYIVEVPAAALEGPFIVLDSFQIDDQNGNNNGLADYGETFSINVTLKNVGADNASGVTATIVNADDYFNVITTGAVSFGTIPTGETGNTTTLNNAFSFSLANNVPDQHQASFDIEITDGTGNWVANIKITAHAPLLSIGDMQIDDSQAGNNDGFLDPGETADIIYTVSNIGSASISNLNSQLNFQGSGAIFVDLNGTSFSSNTVLSGESVTVTFNVSANEDAPIGIPVLLNTVVTGGSNNQYSVQIVEEISIGRTEFLMENGQTTLCYGMFYDSGGPDGNYSFNENYVYTFFPAMEDSNIRVEFLEFDVESHWNCNFDRLLVYDGPDTQSTLLGRFCGTDIPGPFTATSGPLTFHFISDGFNNKPGWVASVACYGPFHDVSFAVTGPNGPIEGALINIDGQEVITDVNGLAVLEDLQAGYRLYSVSKEGFLPVSGSVFVEEDAEVSVSMLPLSTVVFSIKSNQEPIQGAVIAVNGLNLTSNQEGIASIQLANGSYDYTVTKDGFLQVTGQFTVEGNNLEIDVSLQPLFLVTFQVATSGGPLYQAEVKIGGHTMHTNNTGQAAVYLTVGSYPYEVTYMDFPTITGTIVVVDVNVFLGVLLETNITDLPLQEVKIFPNPFGDRIYLSGATEIREVVVTNINGQELLRVANNASDVIDINTGNLPAGVYLVRLVGKIGQTFTHKMVKQ
jgi:hypothetical protein